jgi:hypothetical protein
MPGIRVVVRVKGFDLEYEGALAFFERVIDPLLAEIAPYPGRPPVAAEGRSPASEAPVAVASAPPTPATPAAYRPTSPEFRAFIQKLGPEAGEPDRQILAFAFYLWNYEKKNVVQEAEVEGCFRALGLAVPARAEALYADLAQRLRFLQPTAEARAWTLTTKGANYVKTRLLGAV